MSKNSKSKKTLVITLGSIALAVCILTIFSKVQVRLFCCLLQASGRFGRNNGTTMRKKYERSKSARFASKK